MQQTVGTLVSSDQPASQPLTTRQANHWQRRPINELIALQSEENYTWLHWRTGEQLLLPRTLKYVEERLPAGRFIRLSRDYAVNVDYIERVDYHNYTQMQVWLFSGVCVQVARRRIGLVCEQLQSHPRLAQYVTR
jgi:DNA-binding LytR/AlgR family response regulator